MTKPRLAVATNSTPDWTLDTIIDEAARMESLDGIGIWEKRLEGTTAKAVRTQLDQVGLSCSGVYFLGDFTKGVDNAVEAARKTLDTTAALGAAQVLFLPGPRVDGMSLREATYMAREGLERCADIAAPLGITVSVEPLHPVMIGKYGFTNTLAQTAALRDGVANTSLCLDTWNSWWEPDLDADLERVADDIAWVHLCDYNGGANANPMNRLAVGEGVLPFEQQLRPLMRRGFDGWLEFELMQDKADTHYTADTYGEALRTSVVHTHAVLQRLREEAAVSEAAE